MRELLPLVEMGGERPVLEIEYHKGDILVGPKSRGTIEKVPRVRIYMIFRFGFLRKGDQGLFLGPGGRGLEICHPITLLVAGVCVRLDIFFYLFPYFVFCE